MAQRKLEQMNKLASALGVRGDQREGDAFNRELQVGGSALHPCGGVGHVAQKGVLHLGPRATGRCFSGSPAYPNCLLKGVSAPTLFWTL